MKVGIIGAGMAGLAAARRLKNQGVEPLLFEKSGGLGGRLATRRVGEYVFDTGATTLSPKGSELERVVLEELDRGELVEIERPVYLHSYGRIEPGDPKKNANPRYTYRPGINTMAKLLAEGLEVRRETRIEEIAEVSSGVVLNGERFDAAISTAPVPQAEALMNQGRALPPTEYRPCLSVLLGFDQPFDAPYYALLDPEQDGPLTWLSVETLKSPGRAPQGHTAVVAQLSRRYSRNRYEAADEAIIRDTCVDVARLMGKEFSSPVVSDVKRWKYSQPDNTGSFERANPPGTRLVIASDGLAGGRLELAYDVGLRAADRVLAL